MHTNGSTGGMYLCPRCGNRHDVSKMVNLYLGSRPIGDCCSDCLGRFMNRLGEVRQLTGADEAPYTPKGLLSPADLMVGAERRPERPETALR